RQRAQRHPIVEQSVASAKNRASRLEWTPRESGAWRNVVGVGRDGLKELQIVTQAEVEGQTTSDFPYVLREKSDIRIGLCHHRIVKRLRKARVVVGPAEEVRQRGECVAAANG